MFRPFLMKCCKSFSKRTYAISMLTEIGVMLKNDMAGSYLSGQLFIHKLFGYRGIVVKEYLASLNSPSQSDKSSAQSRYYLVMVDSEDFNGIKNHMAEVAVIENNNILTMRDMDYVSHDDIIPYISNAEIPLVNNMFFQLFTLTEIGEDAFYSPNDEFKKILERHKQSLEVSVVYEHSQDDFKITIIPFYLGSVQEKDSDASTRYWQCLNRIEYTGSSNAIMRKKKFSLFSSHGRIEMLDSKGIQHILNKDKPVIQHHTAFQAKVSVNHLDGHYIFEKGGQEVFVKIPSIRLTHPPFKAFRKTK